MSDYAEKKRIFKIVQMIQNIIIIYVSTTFDELIRVLQNLIIKMKVCLKLFDYKV